MNLKIQRNIAFRILSWTLLDYNTWTPVQEEKASEMTANMVEASPFPQRLDFAAYRDNDITEREENLYK